MMTELKGTLYMIYANYKMSIITFWSILMGVVIISIATTYLFSGSDSYLTLSAPMYFYGPIVGAMVVTGILPFMIKQGVTRFPLFLTLGLFLLITTILNAIFVQLIQGILALIYPVENGVYLLQDGASRLTLNSVGNVISDVTIFEAITVDISITMFLSTIAFFISLIFYKYGKLIGFLFIGAIGILFAFAINDSFFLYDILEKIVLQFNFNYFYYIFALSLVIYALSYVWMARITIKQ